LAKNQKDYKNYYKELYYDFKNNPNNKFFEEMDFKIPDYKVALNYAFLITSSFNSVHPTKGGYSGITKPTKNYPLGKLKLLTILNKLKDPNYQKKFENISSFENLDFEEFMKKYDSEDTFFYLDPPYFSDDDRRANWYGVKDTFGYEAHKRLADYLATTKSKWMLSYYDYPELAEWFPKDKYYWLNKEFFRSSASFSENKEIKGNELLILNYNPLEIGENILSVKEKPRVKIVKPKREAKKETIDNSGSIDNFWYE
jgi:site-specific DNA-adenine methylase